MHTILKNKFCPSIKAVKISYALVFLLITALGFFLMWFDLAGNNAYDLVAKTSEFSLSVAELETAYQRADITARELIVSGKSETPLHPTRGEVWNRLIMVSNSAYEQSQKEMIERLRLGLQNKFNNQDQMIAAGPLASNNLPQDLRAKSVDVSKDVSEMFIALKLEEARGITARANEADLHRRRFRISVFSFLMLIYGIWIVSYLLTISAINARIFAAEVLREKYIKAKKQNENFVGEELYSEVLHFLEQNNAIHESV